MNNSDRFETHGRSVTHKYLGEGKVKDKAVGIWG